VEEGSERGKQRGNHETTTLTSENLQSQMRARKTGQEAREEMGGNACL